MIEERATVVQSGDGYAIVETQQQAACDSCQSADGCGTSLLSGLFKRRRNRLRVLNPIQAQAGDEVIIGLQEHVLLKISSSAYLLPLVCMFMFAFTARQLTERFQMQLGELPIIAGGLLGVIIGLFLVKRLLTHRKSDPNYQAVILRLAVSRQVSFI